MSDRILINSRSGSVNFKLHKQFDNGSFEPEESEIVLQQKLFEEQLMKKFDEGYQQGYDLAQSELSRKYEEKLNEKYDELNNLMAGLDEKMKEYENLFAGKVLDFSFFIGEKIIRREIKNESIIKKSLSEAVKKVIGANSIIIKLNPDEVDSISKENERLLNNNSFSKISFEADERVDSGGCIVESEIGSVDARISSQLNEIKKILDTEMLNENN